jgi:hypothetical protein
MAIREILSVLNANMNLTPVTAGNIHAGMAIARDASGYAVLADRKAANLHTNYIGLAADDTARTGNSFIQADPVGANGLVAGVFTADNNGLFVSAKRALSDYQDESVSNISDLTSGANGYQGPRRGLGVYTTPSGQYVVDIYSTTTLLGVVKSAWETDANGGAEDNDNAAIAINELLTFGDADGAGAGYLVPMDASDTTSVAIARIDAIQNGLCYITML